MPDNTTNTKLVDNKYVPLIIRLSIDPEGNLQRGELVDLNQKIVGLFRQLDELPGLISKWLMTRTGQAKSPPG